MATIHPLSLALLIATRRRVELIDVRPLAQFDRAHIRGTRSMPLRTLRSHSLLRDRTGASGDPLFLICHVWTRASLAAGILGEAGCAQPVVVEGGMEHWEAQGLPIVRCWRHRITIALSEMAAAFGISTAWHAKYNSLDLSDFIRLSRAERPFFRREV